MLSAAKLNCNGNSNGHFLHGASDYEDRPVIDVTPKPASPKWRDQLAPVTWSMSYIDSSQVTHSVTLRGDTEEEVLAMVKPLVAGIRKAKQLAKEKEPQAAVEPDSDLPLCKIHNVPMQRAVSKRTGGTYTFHDLPGRDKCFGRQKKS